MDTEFGIIYNLRDHFKVGLLRSNGHGFLYMNAEALAMFGFKTMDEAVAQPRRILFADCDSYHHFDGFRRVPSAARTKGQRDNS